MSPPLIFLGMLQLSYWVGNFNLHHYQKRIPIILKSCKLVNGKSQLTSIHFTWLTLDWITFPMVPHWQLSVGRAHWGADQQLRSKSTSRYLIDSWLLVGGAHGSTDQWLRKTCWLVTGCGVIRHSNGYFPGGSDGGSYNVGDLGSIPGSGRSPGEGNGNPLQYSCLKIPMNGGAWSATVHGVTKTQTRLSDFTSLHFTTKGCAHAALLHKDTLGPVCWNLFD